MLRFLFWFLLFANAGLAAYQLGYLGALLPSSHEPGRLQRQLNPERLRVVPAPPPAPAVAPPSESSGEPATSSAVDSAPAEAPQALAASTATTPVAACLEVGNFTPDEAERFSDQLGALAAQATRRTVQEAASHMVYMPPQEGRDGAERKAQELRRLGVDDFFIIQDNSSLRWGISLGVFKTEEAARAHLTSLNRKGVRSARLGQRTVTASQIAFQFRDLDAAGQAALDRVKGGFGRQDVKACTGA